MTPKFHCQLPDGRILKVKYGQQNAEVEAEVAGTRLMRALGFGADDMFVVRAVHCAGCPRFPFHSLKCHEKFELPALCFGGPLSADGVRTFASAVIERRLDGTVIEGVEDQGWSWFELDRIDPSRGGATRAEIDAFRLLAVFLAHWDNKGANQRLICQPDGATGWPLRRSIAMIQDLGATFGPVRVDLPSWRATPVWQRSCRMHRSACTRFPTKGRPSRTAGVGGGASNDRRPARTALASAVAELFTASRITSYDGIDCGAHDADAWARVFEDKVREIREAGPCPNP